MDYPRGWGPQVRDHAWVVNSKKRNSSKKKQRKELRKKPKELDNYDRYVRRIYQFGVEDDAEESNAENHLNESPRLSNNTDQVFLDLEHGTANQEAEEIDKLLHPEVEDGGAETIVNYVLKDDLWDRHMEVLDGYEDTQTFDDLPEQTKQAIRRHDCFYQDAANRIFDASVMQNDVQTPAILSSMGWEWVRANGGKRSRDKILKILLHPNVRSFQVRDALGQQNWGDLSARLPMQPLKKDLINDHLPDILGTYLLEGVRCSNASPIIKNGKYVGQAAGCKPRGGFEGGRMGLARRLADHEDYLKIAIRKRQKGDGIDSCSNDQENVDPAAGLRAYDYLAHPDIDHVQYCILSVFPKILDTMEERMHLLCLVTLAETIDIVLQNTMSETAASHWGGRLVPQLRHKSLPETDYEGPNHALPLKQEIKVTLKQNWTPQEVCTFIEVFKKNQSSVYGGRSPGNLNGRTKNAGIKWDEVQRILREHEIEKPLSVYIGLYQELTRDDNPVIESYRSWRFKQHWQFVWRLKTFLEEKGLVKPPPVWNDSDLYYKIPGLEIGGARGLTYTRLEPFLKQHGFVFGEEMQSVRVRFFTSFGSSMLPQLLRKDVWEKLGETVPEYIRQKIVRLTPYLRDRVVDVTLYFVAKQAKRMQSTSSKNKVPAPRRLIMNWPFFRQVYLDAVDQLTTDGVPKHHIFPRGYYNVLAIWDTYSPQQPAPKVLPRWSYDSSKDVHSISTKQEDYRASALQLVTDVEADLGINGEQIMSKGNIKVDYTWPSDQGRYQHLAARESEWDQICQTSREHRGDGLLLPSSTALAATGKHFDSTLGILATLAGSTFDDEADGPTKFSITNYWVQLFFKLERKEWAIESDAELKRRFGWVYHWIRDGKMPAQPSAITNALIQILWGAGGTRKSSLHPYQDIPDCVYDTALIYPDLDWRWVRIVLDSDGSLEKLQSRLQNHHGIKLRDDQLCKNYGVLLAYAWEQAADRGYFDPKADVYYKPRSYQYSRPAPVDDSKEIIDAEATVEPEPDSSGTIPGPDIAKDDPAILEEKIMKLIETDYHTWNGVTHMWLLSTRIHRLGNYFNTALLEEVLKIDPKFASKEKRLCMKLRRHLGLTECVDDQRFQWHGLRIPSAAIGKDYTISVPHPWMRENTSSFSIKKEEHHDPEDYFVFFVESGIEFRSAEGTILSVFPKNTMKTTNRAFYDHERTLQARDPQGNEMPITQTNLRSYENVSRSWPRSELEWLFERVPDYAFFTFAAKSGRLTEDFLTQFGHRRTIDKLRKMVLENPSYVATQEMIPWNGIQRTWLLAQIDKGVAWPVIERTYAEKFKLPRPLKELREEWQRLYEAKVKWHTTGVLAEEYHTMRWFNCSSDPDWTRGWDAAHDAWLLERTTYTDADKAQGTARVTLSQVFDEFNSKFNPKRGMGNLYMRLGVIAEKHPHLDMGVARLGEWTEAETEFVRGYLRRGQSRGEMFDGYRQQYGAGCNEGTLIRVWGELRAEHLGRAVNADPADEENDVDDNDNENDNDDGQEEDSKTTTRKRDRAASPSLPSSPPQKKKKQHRKLPSAYAGRGRNR